MVIKNQTLGILGGGQLGRMSALAAARLGIKTHIFDPDPNCPAAQISTYSTHADYTDQKQLQEFAQNSNVIGYEFENIPLETLDFLSQHRPVYPDRRLLEISQDRLKEKEFLNSISIPTTRWAPANNAEDITKTLEEWQTPKCILKTVRFGYDGKDQYLYDVSQNIQDILQGFKAQTLIIEDIIDFAYEISIVIARDKLGQTAAYSPALNEHKNHILSKTIAPAPIPKRTALEASDMAHHLADAINLVGVLALELFVTKDEKILANEIAPRTHNSGHWTIDACAVSQFDQHVRTICGLPVGIPSHHSKATMINLIGDDVNHIQKYLEMDNACVHLYGKQEVRDGRKMGHVTILE